MIARPAVPFTLRNILDRVGLASMLPRAGRRGASRSNRWERMFAAYGDWSSLLDRAWCSEPPSQYRTERFRRFCPDCEEDTAHEQLDEFGPGWYAQICRCRRCGREGMRIWPLACW
jgi:hypothetical protein